MIGTPALNGWAITFDTTTQKDGGYPPTQPDPAALPNAIMQLLGLHAPLSIEVCRPLCPMNNCIITLLHTILNYNTAISNATEICSVVVHHILGTGQLNTYPT